MTHSSKTQSSLFGVASLVPLLMVAGCTASPSPTMEWAREAANTLDGGLYAQGPAWDTARAQFLDEAADADDVRSLLPALREALRVAGGEHSVVVEGDLAEYGQPSGELPSATLLESGVGVLHIPATSAQSREAIDEYIDAGSTAREALGPDVSCGWIVDVRGNLGGNMYPMLAVLDPLLDTEAPLRLQTREGDISEVRVGDGRVEVEDDGYVITYDADSRITGSPPIVLLKNARTASSGEAIVAAFIGQDNVVVAGAPTFGFSTSNTVHELSDRTTIVLTSALFVSRDGTVHGGEIAPAVPVTAAGESGVQEAAAILTSQCR